MFANKMEAEAGRTMRYLENLNIKTFQKSHDRFLIIDDITYHLGASLKDLGKRWFAFSRFEHRDIRSRLSRGMKFLAGNFPHRSLHRKWLFV